MSAYQGRSGPNFTQFMSDMNGLNQISFDLPEDYPIPDPNDLGMFTSVDFTEVGGGGMSDAGGDLFADFGATPTTSPNVDYQTFGQPRLQAAPPSGPANYGYPQTMNHATFPTTNSPPASSGHTLKRKVGNSESPTVDAEEGSRMAAEEDKRRRNTAASARFRQKKKAREASMEQTVKEIKDENVQLKAEAGRLRQENKWLTELVMEKNGTEEFAQLYQNFRKESEERESKVETKQGVETTEEA